MIRTAIILRNVASNWVGFAVNAAVTLLLTPFVLRELGTAGYGIWILSSSVIGYYGFLDLGFRAGVTQYLTRYLAAGDAAKASECMSSAVAALSALGVALAMLSVGAAWLALRVFQLPPELANEAFWCILIVGVSSGVQFSLSPYTSVFAATQRFDLANLIGVLTRLLTAAGIVAALHLDYGLIGVSGATCAVSLIDYVIRWVVAQRLAPTVELSARAVSLERLKEIGAFGIWNFLISLNAFISQHVPNMLIGLFMPVAAVGRYALSVGLIRQIYGVLSPVGQVLYPAAAALDVQGDRAGLERLYHNGTRLLMSVTVSVMLLAWFWAEDFYRLWVGEEYLSGSGYPSVALVFKILMFGIAANCSHVGGHVLMGAGYVRHVAVTLLAGSIINLVLSIALVGAYGLIGVAAAGLVAAVLVDLIAMPLLVQKHLGMSVSSLLRRAFARPVLAGVFQLASVMGVRLIGPAESWSEFALQGALAAGLCGAILAAVGLTPEERQRFLVRPIQSRKWLAIKSQG